MGRAARVSASRTTRHTPLYLLLNAHDLALGCTASTVQPAPPLPRSHRPAPASQPPTPSLPPPPLQALAKQSHCFFLNITASSIMSKWLGDANRLVRAVFSLAAKLQPCIIFIGASARGTA